MGDESRSVSEAELRVLRVLWNDGPSTVREVDKALRRRRCRWAYTTILTLLRRLCDKGYAFADKSAQPHVFHAKLDRDEMLARRVRELSKELCDGAASPIVQALFKGRKFSSEEVAELRELLDGLEPKDAS